MPKRDPDPLSHAEWKIMRILWRRKRCAAREVYEEAGQEHGWAASTVKTILRRLVRKGYLSTTLVGNSFLYRPVRPAIRSLQGAADDLLDNAVEGTVGPLLTHMVRRSRLSEEELAQLRSLLDQYDARERPES